MEANRCFLIYIFLLLGLAFFLSLPARAQINPWIQNSLYNPGAWDTAGRLTDTFWLHPPQYTSGQEWGVFSGKWRTTPSITGGWGGFRDKLETKGVQFIAAYFGQFAANPVGGERQGESWKGDISGTLFLDMERLVGWKGGYMLTSFTYINRGKAISADFVGNIFPLQLDSGDDDGAARLVHLAIAQELFNQTTEIVLGRIITGDDFAFLSRACTSLSNALCANPIAKQSVTFLTYPFATWGARVKYKPTSAWYAQAGTYLVYSGIRNSNTGGIEFKVPNGAGMMTLAEIGYYPSKYRDIPGLPGVIKGGFYYDSERLTDLKTGENDRGTWGIYLMSEQMLYTEDSKYMEGLSGFLSFSYAPQDKNEITFFSGGGLGYLGLIPGRHSDMLALNYAFGLFSDDLNDFNRDNGDPTQDFELLLELNYRIQVAPWLFLQPDIQYVINPDGRSDIDNAFVIGFGVGTVL